MNQLSTDSSGAVPAAPPAGAAGAAPASASATVPQNACGAAPRNDPFSVLMRLGPAGVLAVIGTVLPPLGLIAIIVYITPIAEWLRSHQDYGPAIYVGLFASLAGLALMPTHAASVVGGWAFGLSIGLLSVIVGFVFASLIGYSVGAWLAGPRVTRVVNENPRWRVVRDALLNAGLLRVLLIVALLRLSSSPFALTNFLLAAVRVPLLVYTLGSVIGVLPRLGVVYVAAQAQKLDLTSKSGWITIAIGVACLFAVLQIISRIAGRALERVAGASSS